MMQESKQPSRRGVQRVLLIGWDAADWQMINPLIQEGKMPCLARFIQDGVSGNLATIQPMLSPMLWTSIATGKRADKHGICGFVEPGPDGNSLRPVTSTARTCKALWNILTQSGLRSNVINWFATHPAEPIHGVMVSNLFAELRGPGPVPGDWIHPAGFAENLAELHVDASELTSSDLIPFIPRLSEVDLQRDNRPGKLAELVARAATTQAVTTQLLLNEPAELTAVYFPMIDHCGHHFMPFHPPKMQEVSQADFELYGRVMEGCYRFCDMLLSGLLQHAGPDTTVILVSDHGYQTGARRPAPAIAEKAPELAHRPFGVVCMKGPGIKKGEKLYGATLLDVTPTVLALLGLPTAMDMDGRVWLESFENSVKPDSIFSWELQPGEAGRPARTEAPAQASEQETEAMRQLIELGYISPPEAGLQERIQNTRRDNKMNLARALLDGRRSLDAVPLLRELLAEEERNTDWLELALAETLIRNRRFQEAREFLGGLSRDKRSLACFKMLEADLELGENRPAEALEILDELHRINPAFPKLQFKRGAVRLALQKWEQAGECFELALAGEPENPFVHNGLAQVLLMTNEPEKALDHALEAVGLLHYFPDAHFHLGVALAKLGKEDEAILAFETCERITQGAPQSQAWLARLLESGNRDPRRAEEYRRKLSFSTDKPDVFVAGDHWSAWKKSADAPQ